MVIYTTTFAQEVSHKNIVADFIRLKLNFIENEKNPPLSHLCGT